jgi:hypothetical protein
MCTHILLDVLRPLLESSLGFLGFLDQSYFWCLHSSFGGVGTNDVEHWCDPFAISAQACFQVSRSLTSTSHLPLRASCSFMSLLHFWDHASIFLHQPSFEATGRRNLSSSSQGALWHFSLQLQGVTSIRISCRKLQ